MSQYKEHSQLTNTKQFKTIIKDLEIPMVVTFGLFGLAFSTLGFHQYYHSILQPYTWMDCLYQAVQLLSLNSGAVPPDAPVPWMLQVGRFLTPLVTFYAIIKTLAAIFRDQWQLIRIRFLHNQTIISGLGRKGWLLTRELRKQKQAVVIIERDMANPHIPEARTLGCSIIIGDARDSIILKKAGLRRASALVSVCGGDRINAEVAAQARKLLKNRKGKPLTCTIHIEDLRLWLFLREFETNKADNESVHLEFFNVFENGAFLLADEYLQLGKISAAPTLLVVGLQRLGEGLILNIARNWAKQFRSVGPRITILAMDRNAQDACSNLQTNYPLVRDVVDLKPLEMDFHSGEFHCGDFLKTLKDGCDIRLGFVCLEDDAAGLNAGLNLQQHLENQMTQIVVVQWEDVGFGSLLEKERQDQHMVSQIILFGLLDHTCQGHLFDDGTHERLARGIHRVYRRSFSSAAGEAIQGPAHVDWENLDEGYRNANRHQAGAIGRKLAALGYRIRPWTELAALDFRLDEETEVEPLARQEHDRWMREKIAQGWRYGPQRNNDLKLHPDLLDWEDPRFTSLAREKDFNTVRNIPAYLLEAGFQIEKINR